MRYDYFENVKNDIIDYLNENYEKDDVINSDRLYDELFTADSVTGNASGSYYCNAWKAEETICHNMELAKEAYENFGYDGINFEYGAEEIDVTIRCYVLGQVLEDAIKEWSEE